MESSEGRRRVLRPSGPETPALPKVAVERHGDHPPELPKGEVLLAEGSTVTINYGEEIYQVQQYQSFRVGGLSVTMVVPPGKPMELGAMVTIVEDRLHQLVEQQFKRRMAAHIERLGQVRDAVRGRGGETPNR